MIYVYDIILNLTDDNRILEFFEWNEFDSVEHIKKIPLFKVNTSLIDVLIHDEIIVDKNFLENIKNLTELFSIKNKKNIEYACLFSDGSKCIAVEFSSSGKVLYRSYLLLDEEEEILDICDNLELVNINYKKIKSRKINFFLTRREFFIQNFLLNELKSSYRKKNYDKIKYLYEECFSKNKEDIKDIYKELVDDITNNFSLKHKNLFNILTMKEVKK